MGVVRGGNSPTRARRVARASCDAPLVRPGRAIRARRQRRGGRAVQPRAGQHERNGGYHDRGHAQRLVHPQGLEHSASSPGARHLPLRHDQSDLRHCRWRADPLPARCGLFREVDRSTGLAGSGEHRVELRCGKGSDAAEVRRGPAGLCSAGGCAVTHASKIRLRQVIADSAFLNSLVSTVSTSKPRRTSRSWVSGYPAA